jgi:hypothetical protein
MHFSDLKIVSRACLYAEDDLDTNAIADAVRHPSQTTRRALEDLTAHVLLNVQWGEKAKDPHRWSLATFARDRMSAFPEMSSNTRSERKKSTSDVLTFRENLLEGVA